MDIAIACKDFNQVRMEALASPSPNRLVAASLP
jgi:hypothetical protein